MTALLLVALALLVAACAALVAVRARRGWRPSPAPPRAVDELTGGSGYGGADLTAIAQQITRASTPHTNNDLEVEP
jgi:hypothetical protein